LNGKATAAAWKSKPSWYLVATEDKMIPVDVQRMMAKRGRKDRRSSLQPCGVSPRGVAKVIEAAASEVHSE
jgi:hypothetical protein